jgi:hypothetical protein
MKYLRYFEQINHKPYPIDIITDSYLETAIWTRSDQDEEMEEKTIYDFSDSARSKAKEEIKWFIDNAGDVFGYVSYTSIGHDLWLSRNGHGAGFFDRGAYDKDDASLLMELADILGGIDIEVSSSDDKIYFFGGSEKYKTFDLEKYIEDREFKKTLKKFNV